jgi:hypothetical protein
MRTLAKLLAITVLASGVVLASNWQSRSSYDALMAMPVQQRQAALRAMEPDAKFAILRTHVQRWLETNRHRLSAEQVTLVREVHDLLTPAQNASPRMIELTQRMRCELWHSDVLSLALTQEDQPKGSTLDDFSYWLRKCVVDRIL